MSQLLNLANGALVVTQTNGTLVLSLSDKESLGGGSAAGILSVQGSGSVILSESQALKLGEALLNKMVPAAILPAVEAGEALANAAVAGA